MRLHDLTVAEMDATDQEQWHRLAQATTSWMNGRQAGGHGEAREADDEA
jgi:hypothetical protein